MMQQQQASAADTPSRQQLPEHGQGVRHSTPNHHQHQQGSRSLAVTATDNKNNNNYNIARLCGWSTSKCGYCKGSRARVLSLTSPSQDDKDRDTKLNTKVGDSSTKQSQYKGDASNNNSKKKHQKGCIKHCKINSKNTACTNTTTSTTTTTTTSQNNNTSNNNNSSQITTSNNSSKSYGVLFDHLSNTDYQHLLNHGWRRSGKHCYLPDNWNSCCPAIPIRLNVLQFSRDKRQNKVWKTMERALSASASTCNNVDDVGGDTQQDALLHEANNNMRRNVQGKKQRMCKRLSQEYNQDAFLLLQEEEGVMNSKKLTSSCHTASSCVPSIVIGQADDDDNINPFTDINITQKLQQWLQQHLMDAIIRVVRDSNNNNNNENIENKQNRFESWGLSTHTLTSLCSFKIQKNQFKKKDKEKKKNVGSSVVVSNQQQHQQKRQQQQQQKEAMDYQTSTSALRERGDCKDTAATIVLSTTACAAIGGRSRGQINTAKLAENVCRILKEQVLSECQCEDEQHEDNTFRKQRIIRVESLPTGHVNVTVLKCEQRCCCDTRECNNGCGHTSDVQHKSPVSPPPVDYLASLLGLSSSNSPHILTVRSVPSDISACQPEVHRLFAKYQTAVHGDEDPYADNDICGNGGNSDGVDGGRFCHEAMSKERIDKAKGSFIRFLVDSPLASVSAYYHASADLFEVDEEGYDVRIPLGSYHQQYRIDGALIAVGVVDILPYCLSSVYSFYDPDLSGVGSQTPLKLNLGKYTALREIEWVRRAMVFRPALMYYYLGFYIHSCTKMRYKAEYKPSCLLCPTHHEWVDFEEAKGRIEAAAPQHCCSLAVRTSLGNGHGKKNPASHSGTGQKNMHSLRNVVANTFLDIGTRGSGGLEASFERPSVTVGMLNAYGRNIVEPLVEDFVTAVGPSVSKSCVIKL